MERYEKVHDKDNWPFGLHREITKETDTKTGEKATGSGWTTKEADRDAHKTLKEADRNNPDYSPSPSSGGSNSDSSGGGSSSSSDSSICYLTTACVNAMALPDNCLELTVLRKFRDDILMPTSKGKEAVKEYYQLALDIVSAVNEKKNAESIWKSLYKDIRIAVSLILSSKHNEALEHYKQMTLRLKTNYLL